MTHLNLKTEQLLLGNKALDMLTANRALNTVKAQKKAVCCRSFVFIYAQGTHL